MTDEPLADEIAWLRADNWYLRKLAMTEGNAADALRAELEASRREAERYQAEAIESTELISRQIRALAEGAREVRRLRDTLREAIDVIEDRQSSIHSQSCVDCRGECVAAVSAPFRAALGEGP